MPPEQVSVALPKVYADGSPLSEALQGKLRFVEVDLSLHLPGMVTLEFYDQDLSLAEGGAPALALGTEIEVKIETRGEPTVSVFKGKIYGLDPTFETTDSYSTFVARSYDKLYMLHRGRSSKTYMQSNDSDVVSAIAQQHGLSTEIEATNETHEIIFRDDMSDYEMLRFLARRNGYVFYIKDGSTLVFKPPWALEGGTVNVEYGENCRQFRPSVSISSQPNSVELRGWDRKTKAVTVGTASRPNFAPTAIGISDRGGALARTANGNDAPFVVSDTLSTAGAAQDYANALIDRIASEDITAEGVIFGNPQLLPGMTITMSATGSRFNGTYFVTRVRHRIPQKGPFETEFWVTGMSSGTLASLVAPDAGRNPLEPRRPINGFMIGIVTNCQDPDALYRVKVKFPTLSEDLESAWAPVVTVGAGNQRGFAILPEVNDEVLVGFEHGDIHRPFVLGGLYNSSDTPPQGQTVLHADGKTEVREWKSRVGHIIRMTDTSGGEKIEIIDKKTANSIVIDSANDTITMKADKDIILEAKNGLIKLEAMNVKIVASSDFQGSGTNTKMEAKASLQLKGATADFVASGMAKVSGSMVMIN